MLEQYDIEKGYEDEGKDQDHELNKSEKPFEELSEIETIRWVENVFRNTGIKPDQRKQSILTDIYLLGELDVILNPENIKKMPCARKDFKESPDNELEIIKQYQAGLLTEAIAHHDASLEVNQKEEDYISNLVMTIMHDLKLLPSAQYKKLEFLEKFAIPDFIKAKEDEQGNVVITIIGEIKTSLKGAEKKEEEQLSKFQGHLQQILNLLNKGEMSQLQERYDLPLLGSNKKILIDPNLKKILYLPSDQISRNIIEGWEIKPLAFNTSELEKLIIFLKHTGLSLITREKLQLPLQYTEKEDVYKEFKKTLDSDLETIERLLEKTLDPIDYYSLLMYGKLPQNDEQRKLINGYGIKNYEEIEKGLSDFLNQNWRILPRLFDKHSSSRYAKNLYNHFKSPMALALVESRDANIMELENKLNNDEKRIFQNMSVKSVESLYQILLLPQEIRTRYG